MRNSEKKFIVKHLQKDDKEFMNQIKEDMKLKKALKITSKKDKK